MKDPLRRLLWVMVLLIVASPWYLFWSTLAALALAALILLPGSFLIALWLLAMKESKE